MTRADGSFRPILLFDLSLTFPRTLTHRFSRSEAPFWGVRNRTRFKHLHSDYPLYSVSCGCAEFGRDSHSIDGCSCLVTQLGPGRATFIYRLSPKGRKHSDL